MKQARQLDASGSGSKCLWGSDLNWTQSFCRADDWPAVWSEQNLASTFTEQI